MIPLCHLNHLISHSTSSLRARAPLQKAQQHTPCHFEPKWPAEFQPSDILQYPEIPNDPVWYDMVFLDHPAEYENSTSFNHQGQPSNHYNLPILPNESKWHHVTSGSKTTKTSVAVFIVAYSILYFHDILDILNIFPCPLWRFSRFPWSSMAGAV